MARPLLSGTPKLNESELVVRAETANGVGASGAPGGVVRIASYVGVDMGDDPTAFSVMTLAVYVVKGCAPSTVAEQTKTSPDG